MIVGRELCSSLSGRPGKGVEARARKRMGNRWRLELERGGVGE